MNIVKTIRTLARLVDCVIETTDDELVDLRELVEARAETIADLEYRIQALEAATVDLD